MTQDRPPVFASPDIEMTPQPDRAILLRSRKSLDRPAVQVGDWIRHWAAATPDAVMLAERRVGGPASSAGERWEKVTYGEAVALLDGLSQALLDLGLSPERPLAVLSEKSVRHGLLLFAALQVGIPVASVSPAYSRRPEARDRLRASLELLAPGLVYVEDAADFAPALDIVRDALPGTRTIARWGDADHGFEELRATAPGSGVDWAFASVTADTVGKIMFTSGSTALPKAVLVTHGNMTSNQQALAQVHPFLAAGPPPVVLDWQPWHHCGGGCFNLHAAIANGGAYYCDLGRPTEDGIGQTIDNLQDVAPTIHFNVPLGYDLLLRALETAPELGRRFFGDLRLIVYSAAGMPDSLWRRLEAAAVNRFGERIPMVSSYGMTEMAPMHTTVHWPVERAGLIGAPVPGCDVKLVPAPDNPTGDPAGRFELRAKGPNISPGYLKAPDLTAAARDEDGWFRSGDAVRLVDPGDANRGLVLDGRLVEQFKLQSGTWVPAGDIRTSVVSHTAPVVRDVLVIGENRSELGVLVFLDLASCRAVLGTPELTVAQAAANPDVRAQVASGLAAYNAQNPASSRRIGRFLLLDHDPEFAAGETTDKGYINQRLAISRRAAQVEALYGGEGETL